MGNLEIIDILCDVTEKLSHLVKEMNTEIQQSELAEELKKEFSDKVEECDKQLDVAEYKLRREMQ